MGTNGLYVFVYNKKYYVFFKGMDSYPKGLGNLLVKEINGWTQEYIENLKQWIQQIKINEEQSYCGFESLEHSVKNSTQYCCVIRTLPPNFYGEGHGHSWIYTIDLDKTQFTVEWIEYTTKHGDFKEWTRKEMFNLTAIPESWIDLLNIKEAE
jgi:hypothetical protein